MSACYLFLLSILYSDIDCNLLHLFAISINMFKRKFEQRQRPWMRIVVVEV